jgi:hypothetical protein
MMNWTSYAPSALEPNSPVETTSRWTVVSWVFFGLVVLSSLWFGCQLLFVHSTSDHPLAVSAVDMVRMVWMVAAYWMAWACSLAGAVSGLIGVSNASHRTKLAWIALALNGSFWFVITAALWIVG